MKTLHDLAREDGADLGEPGEYLGTVEAEQCDCCSRRLRYAFRVRVDGVVLQCGVICATKFLWRYSAMDLRAAARLEGR